MADLDKETVDFVPELRRDHRRAHGPSDGVSEPARQRIVRHRRRHGDQHPAAQHARGDRRRHRGDRARGRSRRRASARCMKAIPGPDFPTGRVHRRARRDLQRLQDRPRRDHACARKATTEENKKGDRVSIVVTEIPYQVNKARLIEKIAELVREKTIEGISDLRDESDRDGMRIVDRAAARRDGRRRAQQPLQAHAAADDLRHHHAARSSEAGRGAPGARDRRALHRVPARSRPAPDRVRAAQGGSARAHPRRAEDRARPPRRGDHADSRVEEPVGSARGLDCQFSADRRSRRRPSWTCSCSGSPGLERQKILDELAELQKTIERLRAILPATSS